MPLHSSANLHFSGQKIARFQCMLASLSLGTSRKRRGSQVLGVRFMMMYEFLVRPMGIMAMTLLLVCISRTVARSQVVDA